MTNLYFQFDMTLEQTAEIPSLTRRIFKCLEFCPVPETVTTISELAGTPFYPTKAILFKAVNLGVVEHCNGRYALTSKFMTSSRAESHVESR
jgi:hypothetical protein